jgi:hypothetical protein
MTFINKLKKWWGFTPPAPQAQEFWRMVIFRGGGCL